MSSKINASARGAEPLVSRAFWVGCIWARKEGWCVSFCCGKIFIKEAERRMNEAVELCSRSLVSDVHWFCRLAI